MRPSTPSPTPGFARDETALWPGSLAFGGKTFLLAALSVTEQVTLGAGGGARRRVTAEMFRVEYELQEPSVEGRVIDGAAVDAAFDPSYGRFTGERDEPIELPCCQSYVPGNDPCTHHAYATGADRGQRRDRTVIATYRTDTADDRWRLVLTPDPSKSW